MDKQEDLDEKKLEGLPEEEKKEIEHIEESNLDVYAKEHTPVEISSLSISGATNKVEKEKRITGTAQVIPQVSNTGIRGGRNPESEFFKNRLDREDVKSIISAGFFNTVIETENGRVITIPTSVLRDIGYDIDRYIKKRAN